MSTYTEQLQAELDALNVRRAALAAIIDGPDFAGLSEADQAARRLESNFAASQAEGLRLRISSAEAM